MQYPLTFCPSGFWVDLDILLDWCIHMPNSRDSTFQDLPSSNFLISVISSPNLRSFFFIFSMFKGIPTKFPHFLRLSLPLNFQDYLMIPSGISESSTKLILTQPLLTEVVSSIFDWLGTKNQTSVLSSNSHHSEQYCAWTTNPFSVHSIITES